MQQKMTKQFSKNQPKIVQNGVSERLPGPSLHWAAPGCLLDGSWAIPGPLLGSPGAPLGASWAPPGPFYFFFAGVLGPTWGPPGVVRHPLGPLRSLSGRPGGSFLAPRGREHEIKQRNEKYTFRHGKTYNSEGLVGALGRPWAHLGSFFGTLAPLFDMIVSPSTSSLNLSRLKPLLDPSFFRPGRPKSRKKKN